MKANRHQATLRPFEKNALTTLLSVQTKLTFQMQSVHVLFSLSGATDQINLEGSFSPQPHPSSKELWQHTCFEFFCGPKDRPSYVEWNFSPSGEWAQYWFEDYRKKASHTPVTIFPPLLSLDRGEDGSILFSATMFLPEEVQKWGGFRGNATAILEDKSGNKTYWAAHHPVQEKPDFHHQEAFTVLGS